MTDRVRVLNTKTLCLICESEITALRECSFVENPIKDLGQYSVSHINYIDMISLE